MFRALTFGLFFSLTLSNPAHALIGGVLAKEGEGDGIFQIAIKEKQGLRYSFCTASKIGSNTIMLTAHCLKLNQSPQSIKMSTLAENEVYEYHTLNVKKTVIHKEYHADDTSMTAPDIALIIVNTDDFFNKIQVKELDFKSVSANQKVEYWGYGCQQSNHLTNDPPIKKKANNLTLNKTALQRNFGALSPYVRFNSDPIYKSNLLTPGVTFNPKASSICAGDSGGPVLLNNKIVGINIGFLAKDADDYGRSKDGLTDINLHLRISKFDDWIKSNMRSK